MAIWALIWLGFFFLLGFFRGFWNALATLLAAVLAVVGSTLLAGPTSAALASILEALPGGDLTRWWISAVALFIVIGALVRWGVKWLGQTLPLSKIPDRLGGGALGALHSAGIGIVLIWGFSVVIESPWLKSRLNETQKNRFLNSDLLAFSQSAMGGLIAWQSSRSGMPERTVKLSSTFAAKPSETLSSLKNAVQSDGFKTMMQNDQLKQWAADGKIAEIAKSPAFDDFLADPQIGELRRFLRENGVDVSREDMAAQTAEWWGQAQDMRNDPGLQDFLSDPEVQRFLDGEGDMSTGLLMKAKQALSLLSAETENIDIKK